MSTGHGKGDGEHLFGPIRGDRGTEQWEGWWGDDPPYHMPVFVLTHHERDPIEKDGGTTFHFVTHGIESALERAGEAAGEKDVIVAGGASAIRQYLAAGLIDEIDLHLVPVVLGAGERLLEGVGELNRAQLHAVDAPGLAHLSTASWSERPRRAGGIGGPKPCWRSPPARGRSERRDSKMDVDCQDAERAERRRPRCESK